MRKCILTVLLLLLNALSFALSVQLTLPYFSASSLNTTLVPVDNVNWMMKLRDDVNIRNLAIPGAHDSCAFDFTSKTLIVDSFGYTQKWNLNEQLYAGIRYFDIRVRSNGWVYHGIRGTTSSFVSVMQTFTMFLNAHPQEGLIMRLQCNPLDDVEACMTDDVLAVLDMYKSKLLLTRQVPLVKDIRGKVFLIVENLRYYNAFEWNGTQMTLQDYFSDITVEDKRKKVKMYIDLSKRRKDLFIVNHCSATYYGITKYNVEYAIGVNEVVYNENGFSGVFPMDFPGEEVVTHIIRQNDGLVVVSMGKMGAWFVMWVFACLVGVVGLVIGRNWYYKHSGGSSCSSEGNNKKKYYIVISENDGGKEPLLVNHEEKECCCCCGGETC